jgi:hypothetical protein
MKTIETRKYDMLVRVRNFGEAYKDRFPKGSLGGRMFAAVEEAVKELDDYAASKVSTKRGGEGARRLAQQALFEQLDAMSATARQIEADRPEVNGKFQVPATVDDRAVLTAARVFAHDAEAFKASFVAHGMSRSFLADLNVAMKQYAGAIRKREAGRVENTTARISIEAALASGVAATRKLHVIVHNIVRDDDMAIALWEKARRIDWPPVKAAAAAPGTNAAPAAPGASTTPAAAPVPAATAPATAAATAAATPATASAGEKAA